MGVFGDAFRRILNAIIPASTYVRLRNETLFEGSMADAFDRLGWAKDGQPLSLTGAAVAQSLERKYAIRLPEDFLAYLKDHAPATDWWDDRCFVWWAPERIKSLRDECPDEMPAEQRNCEIDDEADRYLVFADFLDWCYAYAICCSDGPNRGKVALISASPDRFVADSFTHFVRLAASDSRRLHMTAKYGAEH